MSESRTPDQIRVLLVDDSPTVLAVLKKMLSSSPDIQVVGTAANGREGLEQLAKTDPHVICTDLNMPVMDGLEFTRRVMEVSPRPIMVISSEVDDRDSPKVFNLLKAGAIEIFPKPKAGLSPENDLLRQDLIKKIRVLKGIVVFHKFARDQKPIEKPPEFSPDKQIHPVRYRILGIGSSTGGPQALLAILPRLPADFPVPILCVQHISPGFLDGLVAWLGEHCRLKVRIATRGERPMAGLIYFPPEGWHLALDSSGCFEALDSPPYNGHRPAANVTFASIAERYGNEAIAILLTGMGDDGAAGMAALFAKGALTIAQDEKSSTVFGMPRAAIERGAATEVLPLDRIANRILELTVAGRP